MLSQEILDAYIKKAPIIQEVMDQQSVIWLNENAKKMADVPPLPFSKKDMEEVLELWERFRPFLKVAFKETAETDGIISSPLKEISSMKKVLEEEGGVDINRLFLKCDSDLVIAGSIKARGGFYEVLHYAEKLALEAGMVTKDDNYEIFASEDFKQFFSQYKIGVGSTGNLGISIGIMGAKLGFQASVYVSNDAKEWKKEYLRANGARVVEFDGDFNVAIAAGRKETVEDPMGYFVDDEDSQLLYIGYSLGALELQKDLEKQGIIIDEENPLIMYLPCGVGGSSGGVAFGIKQIFGDAAHCFFVEPLQAPCVLLGLATGEMNKVSVQDFGLENKTEADGLAVGRASAFATEISNHLVAGVYTIPDDNLYELLAGLWDNEKIFIEPSSTAGLIGPQMLAKTSYAADHNLNMDNAIHVAWATGGSLVPQKDREDFYNRGKR